jgi:hypothetical protein
MEPAVDARVLFLRHTLAALAYRAAKAVGGAPPSFSGFEERAGSRTPGQILAHIGDLMDWAVELAAGRHTWHDSAPQAWDADVARVFAAMKRLDDALAQAPAGAALERIFQGPVADALTHVGQIAMLRRMAGAPIRGENYFKADIAAGRIDPAPGAPRAEFD